jgi:hypothetical protein
MRFVVKLVIPPLWRIFSLHRFVVHPLKNSCLLFCWKEKILLFVIFLIFRIFSSLLFPILHCGVSLYMFTEENEGKFVVRLRIWGILSEFCQKHLVWRHLNLKILVWRHLNPKTLVWRHLNLKTLVWRHLNFENLVWMHLNFTTIVWMQINFMTLVWMHLNFMTLVWRHLNIEKFII